MPKLADYKNKLKEIKQEVKEARWKYLRENKEGDFSETKNTTLQDYLEYIFPNTKDWTWSEYIPDAFLCELASRELLEARDYKPDAFSQELKLVVEFDGKPHYQNPTVIINDKKKDEYCKELGLTVVRIPYWIQLSKENIYYLFDAVKDRIRDDLGAMCTLEYSFFDSPRSDFGLNTSPASMCALGFRRFCEEVQGFPEVTRNIIKIDLNLVSKACKEKYNLQEAYGIDPAMRNENPLFK